MSLMSRWSMRRAGRVWRAPLLLLGAVGLAMCVDSPSGPDGRRIGRANFSFDPEWETNASRTLDLLADVGLEMDRVRIVIVRPPRDTLKDTTITMHAGDPPVELVLSVVAIADETLDAGVQFKSGESILFEGTVKVRTVINAPAAGTTPPTPIVIVYVGPGANATRVAVSPASGDYATTVPIQFTAVASDDANTTFPNTPFAWSIDDATLGAISTTGLFTPSGKRGNLVVTAATPKNLKGTATATLVPTVTSIVIVSGDNQTGLVKKALPQPLIVSVRASDGLGVAGQTVNFAAADGGAVDPASAVTDANGNAQTTLKLDARLGVYNFGATSNGFVVAAKATGAVGPAAKIGAAAGATQSATVGTQVPVPPTVRVTDADDNPVSGITVTFARGADVGTLTGPVQVTNADGLAKPTNWVLGPTAGPNTLTATTAEALTGSPVTFTAEGLAADAAKLSLSTAPSPTVASGAPFAVQPVVQLRDALDNPSPTAGVAVTVAIGEGGGTLGGTLTATTNASGLATFTDLSIAGIAGPRTLLFTAPGINSVSASTQVGAGTAKIMAVFNGNGQSATAGSNTEVPPRVKITDASANPVAGIPVAFTAGTGGGKLNGGATSVTVLTDADGRAGPAVWTLGVTAGLNSVIAAIATEYAGPPIDGTPITFTATGTPGSPAKLTLMTSFPTQVQSGVAFAVQSVQLRDANENPVPQANVAITLSPFAGGGSLSGTTIVNTNGAGIASFSGVSLSGSTGPHTLRFTGAGLTPLSVSTTITSGAPARMFAIAGFGQSGYAGLPLSIPPAVKVVDAANVGVAGVTVIFEVTGGGGSVTTRSVATADDGIARTTWQLGTTPGLNALRATAIDTSSGGIGFIGTIGTPSLHAASFAGNPVMFAASGFPFGFAPPSTVTWTGATSTSWKDASNWSPARVPSFFDSVVVNPLARQPTLDTAVFVVGVLQVNEGATVTLNQDVIVISLDTKPTAAINGTGKLRVFGPSQIAGSFNNLTLGFEFEGGGGEGGGGGDQITTSLVGATTVTGDFFVALTSRLEVGSNTLMVNGEFKTMGAGVLVMNQSTAALQAGKVTFAGGVHEYDMLTFGEIRTSGDFRAERGFYSYGTNVRFTGSALQSVTVVEEDQHFHSLIVENTHNPHGETNTGVHLVNGSVNLISTLAINVGQLTVATGTTVNAFYIDAEPTGTALNNQGALLYRNQLDWPPAQVFGNEVVYDPGPPDSRRPRLPAVRRPPGLR